MSYLNHVLKYFDLAKNYRTYQLDLIKNFIGNKILEIGPGNGEIIEHFINDKRKITLIDNDSEISKVLNKKFKDHQNIKILNSEINSVNEKFNSILYMDVIEHIENDIEELDRACNLLSDSGKLIIIVPAFNFLFSDFDKDVGHYRRYYKKNFLEYAKSKRLKILSLKYFDSIGFLILCMSKLLNFKGRNNAVIGIKVWNLLMPLSRLIDKLFFHQFGKSLICVIQKNAE